MLTKCRYLLVVLFLSYCSDANYLNITCEKCDENSFRQFPELKEINGDKCNICVLKNISSDTLKVGSLREGSPYFFNQRRYKKGHKPNPFPALGGFDVGKIEYNIIILPKGSYSFPCGSVMHPTEKYDKIEFEIRYLKNGKEYSKWIGCQM